MIKMKFDEAFMRMNKGKTVIVKCEENGYKFYRIENNVLQVKYTYDGEYTESNIRFNVLINYDFIDEDEYVLTF